MDRHCKHCGRLLERRSSETSIGFLRRHFCSFRCEDISKRQRDPKDPTPGEIQARAERIRESWPEHRYKETDPAPVETQVIYVSDLELQE